MKILSHMVYGQSLTSTYSNDVHKNMHKSNHVSMKLEKISYPGLCPKKTIIDIPKVQQHPLPLSPEAQNALRPPKPALLLEAKQERPYIPANPRIAHAIRVNSKAS